MTVFSILTLLIMKKLHLYSTLQVRILPMMFLFSIKYLNKYWDPFKSEYSTLMNLHLNSLNKNRNISLEISSHS